MNNDDILFDRRGKLGLITLNRPKALNAISLDMVQRMAAALDEWAMDDRTTAVLIQGAGGKAFAAGGDIQRLYDAMSDPADDYPVPFFAEEYRLNRQIKTYPKPFIAVFNGIIMGGGVGVSVHGSHRIATDKTTFAMPETGIGFFPDVGGTYFLPRLNGGLGRYMALTGGRLDGGDCVAEGLADSYLPVAKIDALIEALATADNVDDAIASAAAPAPKGRLAKDRQAVAVLFDRPTVNDVLAALEVADTEWAAKQMQIIRSKSPLSVAITWEQLNRGAKLNFEDCLVLEYRLALAACAYGEFREGVRALIVDKDNAPKWSHAAIEDVPEADVLNQFNAPTVGDLTF
ncbi:MAG: enoyl-CoA hydratase/isomerase family protein [Alphaproteobacteria bacterium]